MSSPLLHFLSHARSAILHPSTSTSTPPIPPITLVLGNPSCDLDSFISATIYSYFHSRPWKKSASSTLHIPLLNLATTPSSELWRLRPEFGTALRLALRDHVHDQQEKSERENDEEAPNKGLLENLLTISDIRASSSSRLNYLFSTAPGEREKIPAVLVDHNALSLSIPNIPDSEIETKLDTVGCIDHHVDESSVPVTASPRIIRTGVGSCTSLVVQYLRDEGFWRDLLVPASVDRDGGNDDAIAAAELAKLSLASVLIDTANLTAEGKVSDLDRDVVNFLEGIINNNENQLSSTKPTITSWNRKAFYTKIAESKANSLELLTLAEIFERDYKAWNEKTRTSGQEIKMGIASVVKPITWLIQKSGSSTSENFIAAMQDFARQKGGDKGLDVFAIMTTSTSPTDGKFQRELLILALGERGEGQKLVRGFEELAGRELKLEEWREDEGLLEGLKKQQHGVEGGIWWQGDVGKSRKQVAPMLREAIRNI